MEIQSAVTLETKSRKSKRSAPAVPVNAETNQERQLKLLKNRLLPLSRLKRAGVWRKRLILWHPVYGPKLDMRDSSLLKWLLHCDTNALYAEAKIRACLEYRRKHNIDDIALNYKLPDIASYYAGGLCGVDKQGSPVYYELFGILNFKEIMLSSTKEQLIKFKIYQHEQIIKHLKRLSRASGQTVDTILVIVNMQMCNKDTLWNPAVRAWAEIIEVLQDLYPGLVKEVLIINVHFTYPELYISLRPYLSRSTVKLIKVLGQGYLPHLLERIEKHEIPAFLGGYKCDSNNNPLCMAHLNWSTSVPQYLHQTNKRMVVHATERIIPGGEKKIEEYHVSTANSILLWEFYEVNHPIVFSICLNTLEDQAVVLRKTLVSNNLHHLGSLMCHTRGRYYFILDNCKDYAHPAKVVFRIEVKIPENLLDTLSPKLPLGDTINFRKPVGDKEHNLRQKLFNEHPHMLPKVALKL